MSPIDRQRGCLLGLAIGDALGAAVEFKHPGTFKPVTGYRAGGPHGLNPGEWTDDTSMALALADSIATVGWNLNDQADRYSRWANTGKYSVNGRCFDIGGTVSSALRAFQISGDAFSSASRDEGASGNGSIMRLAPVPIHFAGLFPNHIELLAKYAAESSLPTHASPQCLSASRYMALVLAAMITGVGRDDVLAPDWGPLQQLRKIESLHPAVDAVAAGSFRELKPPDIEGGGYVVKSLEAALWAFHDAQDFREAALKAVNLGDDADTTGAVCGQLAGAYWGESGIPQEWLDGLAKREMIEEALAGLFGETGDTSRKPIHRVASSEAVPPAARSYWVVEDKLLAGAYPGSPNEAEHCQRVEQLWEAGIRTFINLIEEEEANLSGHPFTGYDDILQELATKDGEEVVCLRFPVEDLSVPTTKVMQAILDAIDRSIAEGRPVYVHCFGGVGRTGTAVCCWLLRHGLADSGNAIDVLRELRQSDQQTRGRKAPETREQVEFVRSWLEGQ